MNKKFLAVALFGSFVAMFAANKNDDPVIMTINGEDVRLSEFQYLYNKNNSQQAEPVTFDQYVDMFIDYKLKVADAKAAGIDTTKAFKDEFIKFSEDLAYPYLTDSEVNERLVREAYDRMAEEVKVSHIMLPLNSPNNPNSEQRADSIRNLILSGEITFERAARRFSMDIPSAQKGGTMGWVVGNSRLPWKFEEIAFNTPVGELSEVINSGFGYHIIRPEMRRPASGEVNVSHILILTQGKSDEEKVKAKEKIDSLYSVVSLPDADFAAIATAYSEDPGSARRGGELGWFGRGRMVEEFDSISFALPDNAISKPFATSYGYHIIKKHGHRGGVPLPPLEDLRDEIQRAIDKDSRAHLPVEATVNRLVLETNSSVNDNLSKELSDFFKQHGYETLDSAALVDFTKSNIIAFNINGKPYRVASVIDAARLMGGMSVETFAMEAPSMAKDAFEKEIIDYGRSQLINTNAEYRNLINEYRDGILLFDISNKNVWNRAAEDKDGLKKYFEANRDKYVWNAPKFKSYVVFTTNDSILELAREYANANFSSMPIDNALFQQEMKKRFGKEVRIERVIAAQGENAITDYLGFGGPKPAPRDHARWNAYFAFGSQIIDAPQEVDDVKGQVTADYQTYLEKEWLNRLHKTYKHKVNKKVLKKAAEAASNK